MGSAAKLALPDAFDALAEAASASGSDDIGASSAPNAAGLAAATSAAAQMSRASRAIC